MSRDRFFYYYESKKDVLNGYEQCCNTMGGQMKESKIKNKINEILLDGYLHGSLNHT